MNGEPCQKRSQTILPGPWNLLLVLSLSPHFTREEIGPERWSVTCLSDTTEQEEGVGLELIAGLCTRCVVFYTMGTLKFHVLVV